MPSMEILTICAGMLVLVLVLCSRENSFSRSARRGPPDRGQCCEAAGAVETTVVLSGRLRQDRFASSCCWCAAAAASEAGCDRGPNRGGLVLRLQELASAEAVTIRMPAADTPSTASAPGLAMLAATRRAKDKGNPKRGNWLRVPGAQDGRPVRNSDAPPRLTEARAVRRLHRDCGLTLRRYGSTGVRTVEI